MRMPDIIKKKRDGGILSDAEIKHFVDGYTNGSAIGHFALETKDMDEFDKKLKAFGGEYLYEPYVMEAAQSKIAFIKDPDGNEIEIIQKL